MDIFYLICAGIGCACIGGAITLLIVHIQDRR